MAAPRGTHTWFDWVVVERLWTRQDPGRNPTYPEILELLRLARAHGVSNKELARRLDRPERTITRWAARFRDELTLSPTR